VKENRRRGKKDKTPQKKQREDGVDREIKKKPQHKKGKNA